MKRSLSLALYLLTAARGNGAGAAVPRSGRPGGTLWMLPDYYVFFGVLHAIALFSLMALALLRLPAWGQAGN